MKRQRSPRKARRGKARSARPGAGIVGGEVRQVVDVLGASAVQFAQQIGERVRAGRARRGMTRKMLAEYSGASERYLAHIESGRGNPSVLVLREIARGLGQDIVDLLPTLRANGELFRQAASALDDVAESELPALVEHIKSVAARRRASDRARRIALVGLRGAGKSTLGARLADALGCPFVELDRLVERSCGASISLMIEMAGQATFRKYERKCLHAVVEENEAVVIATAGGLVAERETYSYLLERCHVIWLQANPEDHMSRVIAQGDLRPMAHDREALAGLRAILAARVQDYAKADLHLGTSGHTVAESSRQLLERVRKLLGRP